MGSYSSLGRGGGSIVDHGNHLDRNRDIDNNDNSRVGSYVDMASSVPSYAEMGVIHQGGGNGFEGGGAMSSNKTNSNDVVMSSYAQMGESSQPPQSLGVKRGRPPENRPHQMMSSNNYVDDMAPRSGGGPPSSYRGHSNRDGPQHLSHDYRPPDLQDRRSLSHQAPPLDDQFGRRSDWGRSETHDDHFGRPLPPKRTSSGYVRGSPGRGHPRFVPDANRADVIQRPELLSPPPRRESSYNRFDGPRSHDASMPSYASIADKPMPQPAEEHRTQQHENSTKDDAVVEIGNQLEAKVVELKRPTSPPPDPTPVVVVPPSPESPPPAPPSAYALAMARMVEMNADMEFAWVRMQMLDTEVKLIEARLEYMD